MLSLLLPSHLVTLQITHFHSTRSWLLCPIPCLSFWSIHQYWHENIIYKPLFTSMDTFLPLKPLQVILWYTCLSQLSLLFILPSLHSTFPKYLNVFTSSILSPPKSIPLINKENTNSKIQNYMFNRVVSKYRPRYFSSKSMSTVTLLCT